MVHHEMITSRLLAYAHQKVADAVSVGDVVVDATLGNGHDTLFLARSVGDHGRVIGFDVQQRALDATSQRLLDSGVASSCFELHLESHDQISHRVTVGECSAIMFKLGYLPGSDKSLVTETESTLNALSQAVSGLCMGGVLTIMCYPGHAGGDIEADHVVCWADDLGELASDVRLLRQDTSREFSPFLVVITKS